MLFFWKKFFPFFFPSNYNNSSRKNDDIFCDIFVIIFNISTAYIILFEFFFFNSIFSRFSWLSFLLVVHLIGYFYCFKHDNFRVFLNKIHEKLFEKISVIQYFSANINTQANKKKKKKLSSNHNYFSKWVFF